MNLDRYPRLIPECESQRSRGGGPGVGRIIPRASLAPAPCPRPSSCPPWAADGARWEVKVLLELPLPAAAAQSQSRILSSFAACFFTCWAFWGGNTDKWFRNFERGDVWEVKCQSFSKQRFCRVRRLQCINRARPCMLCRRKKKDFAQSSIASKQFCFKEHCQLTCCWAWVKPMINLKNMWTELTVKERYIPRVWTLISQL